jgi:hypothetical protein
MIRILLTGFSFVSPDPDATADEVVAYVESMLRWLHFHRQKQGEVVTSCATAESLVRDGCYPVRPALQQLLSAKQIVEFDANTIARVVETALQLNPSFESCVGIREVLCEEVSIEPEFRDARFPNTSDDLERCIICALLRPGEIDGIALPVPLLSAEIRASAVVHIVEGSEVMVLPQAISGSSHGCASPDDAIRVADEVAQFVSAASDEALHSAIELAIAKHFADQSQSAGYRTFAIGRDFRATLNLAKTDGARRRVIRAIIESILKTSLNATHHLRENAGATSPQQQRGRDKAWRRDVDHDLHLHYWECVNGHVEIANLVQHNEFGITD